MNRIVLIGNGFDLAHGLNTRYSDFIEYLCSNICNELREQWEKTTFEDKYKLVSLTTDIKDMDNVSIMAYIYKKNNWNLDDQISNAELFKLIFDNRNKKSNVLIANGYQVQMKYSMPNRFFNTILIGNNRWADIEQLYYDNLLNVKDKEADVSKLNKDFEIIKQALQDYLSLLPQPTRNVEIADLIYCPIYFREIKEDNKEAYCEDIKLVYDTKISSETQKWLETSRHWYQRDSERPFIHTFIENIKRMNSKDEDLNDFLLPDNVYILSFNYTRSEDLYKSNIKNRYKQSWIEVQTNHIHGQLDKTENPIVFGYGDEYDTDYGQLEKSRVKGVLDNIKSMKYLETTNYRDFESFINGAPYQVIILGHSCALSDNTLLRTLFEHDNCVSIKPYYYEQVKENSSSDNYSEIIQALSRCFTDKSKLRSVVVNKKWCNPLPQHPKENKL